MILTRTARALTGVTGLVVAAVAVAGLQTSGPPAAHAMSAGTTSAATPAATPAAAPAWGDVGEGWTVAMHRARDLELWRASSVSLVSPEGSRLRTGVRLNRLAFFNDVSDDGRRLVTTQYAGHGDAIRVVVHRLDTGAATWFDVDLLNVVRFLDREGTRLLVVTGLNPPERRLAVHTTGGRLLQVLHEPRQGRLTYEDVLPAVDGRSVLLTRNERVRRVDAETGATIATLQPPSPVYRRCVAARWWNDTTPVLRCAAWNSRTVVFLHRPDGSSPRLTPGLGVHGMGWHTAWYHRTGNLGLEYEGCGPSTLRRLVPGLPPVPLSASGAPFGAGVVGIRADLVVAITSPNDGGCGGPAASLLHHDLATGRTRTVLGAFPGRHVVQDALMVSRRR